MKATLSIENVAPPTSAGTENPEVLALRRRYLDATAALCALSGMEYTGKLSNVQYDAVAQAASVHPQAGALLTTIFYCGPFSLGKLEGESWWDNIPEDAR